MLVGVPQLRGVAVTIDVLGDDVRQLKSQRIGYRFLCHAVTVTGRNRNVKSPRDSSFSRRHAVFCLVVQAVCNRTRRVGGT
ncbi:Uncharacterised protein [Mycobacteroides abscessus subsp. abscessus]|nr:Uncharacterised protein [Mycobacteroides abscessus subsp. abscessus]